MCHTFEGAVVVTSRSTSSTRATRTHRIRPRAASKLAHILPTLSRKRPQIDVIHGHRTRLRSRGIPRFLSLYAGMRIPPDTVRLPPSRLPPRSLGPRKHWDHRVTLHRRSGLVDTIWTQAPPIVSGQGPPIQGQHRRRRVRHARLGLSPRRFPFAVRPHGRHRAEAAQRLALARWCRLHRRGCCAR